MELKVAWCDILRGYVSRRGIGQNQSALKRERKTGGREVETFCRPVAKGGAIVQHGPRPSGAEIALGAPVALLASRACLS